MTATPLTPPTASSDDWGDFVAADQLSHSPDLPLDDNHKFPPNHVSTSAQILQHNQHHLTPHPPHQVDPHPDSQFANPFQHDDDSPTSSEAPTHITPDDIPLQGFDTLDPVQRYALGAVAVVLLNEHNHDLNGKAFAISHVSTILTALGLRDGQQAALLALDPDDQGRQAVVDQCVQLVGDDDSRFAAVQAILALAVAKGDYDARGRMFLAAVAHAFGISWRAVAAVELAVAIQLCDQAAAAADADEGTTAADDTEKDEGNKDGDGAEKAPRTVDELLIERRKKKMRIRKAVKISGITLVGGMLFGLTGGLIAPALLSALAGVGVASAAGLAASGTVASGAVVGGLFGVAGAGFTVKKARNRVSTNLEEFDFERSDDPRVIEERKKKAERERLKMEKLVAQRLREEAEASGFLAIEDVPEKERNGFDPEKELPRPPTLSDDEYDDEGETKKYRRFGSKKKKKKKREKRKVGARGLEAASHFPSLHVCICVPSWLTERSFGAALDQFEPALKHELPASQHIALRWESRRLFEMGLAFAKFWASKATVTTVQQAYPHAIAAASTVAGAVAFAFAIPLTIMSCMDYVDNPWSILVSRSNGAGDELADVLVERSYGKRPVSLFGYSIGARVVFKCLESLAERGALGIVDNVYVMGAAVTADPERWKKIRSVVAGRIVNAYGSYDWALAFFHRGCGHGVYVSGLRRVELEGVENLNMSYLGIEGHRELKDCVPRVMKAMGLGVGYIVMPPARLVRRRNKSKSRARSDSPVCEEPERLANREKNGSNSSSPSENGSDSNLANMHNDSFWNTDSPVERTEENELEIDRDLALPPNVESQASSNTLAVSAGAEISTVNMTSIDRDRTKKKKSKSWLSWNAWTGHGSKSSRKSKSTKAGDGSRDVHVTGIGDSTSAVSVGLEASLEASRPSKSDDKHSSSTSMLAESDIIQQGDSRVATIGDGNVVIDDVIALQEDDEDGDDGEEFDWEKQRRIWEEQERQIQERGYADSAAEIEMSRKMVLGVGIEVAGRRVHRYLEQDADLPVPKKEEIFTNCLEDQRGVVVRIYEHEKRTKSVSLNTLKSDELYPKLLGELEVQLRQSAVKGQLRIAVAMWACENGDVCAEAEERFADGSVGDRAELLIRRTELCTMAERTRLEAAERKRIEAQLQKEMRIRAGPDVLALPPASSTASEQPFEAGQSWGAETENVGKTSIVNVGQLKEAEASCQSLEDGNQRNDAQNDVDGMSGA